MDEKPDTRIGATKESLDELKEKISRVPVKLAPPGEEYTKIAIIFGLPIMRADAETVLNLPEEARTKVLAKLGEAFCESLMKTTAMNWELDWLTQVAKASMGAMFRGILSLDPETKQKVLAAQAKACFLDHMKKMSPAWDKVGITYEPGTYHPDGAVALFASGLTLRDVSRHKDTIFWIGNTRKHYERCCCPIYRTGMIDEQLPEYCECAVQFMKFQFEYLTGQPMEAELVETLNCGNADVCSLRVHMKPTWAFTRYPMDEPAADPAA